MKLATIKKVPVSVRSTIMAHYKSVKENPYMKPYMTGCVSGSIGTLWQLGYLSLAEYRALHAYYTAWFNRLPGEK